MMGFLLRKNTRGRPAPRWIRVLARIERDAVTGCWNWQGCVNHHGYANAMFGSICDGSNGTKMVHRVAYEEWVGPIPTGLFLDHLCRNRRCVNPNHLEPVSNAENSRRAAASRPTCPKGHEYTPENTLFYGRKQRRTCKTCERSRHQSLSNSVPA